MSYDSTHPKVSQISFLSKLANSSELNCEDVSFMARMISPRYLGLFYGTDMTGIRHAYGFTLLDALNARIVAPMTQVWEQRQACFFKPYQSVWQGLNGAFDGLFLPIMITIQALGLLGFWGSPYAVIGAACFPAFPNAQGFLPASSQVSA